MISHTSPQWQSCEWQSLLQSAIRDSDTLLKVLGLTSAKDQIRPLANPDFPILAPLPFVARMKQGDPNDPLLLQVLATDQEIEMAAEGLLDPLNEAAFTPVPGLIHKYHGRVLLLTSGRCAINCRYCFRRHSDYSATIMTPTRKADVIQYLRTHPEVSEVILSGGDPLLRSDQSLAELITELETIPHIRRLRIHSRLPIVIPQRVTQELCRVFDQSHLKICVVIHANHTQELDTHVAHAMHLLRSVGVTLLNQSVALQGVNADVDTLEALSYRLYDIGVLPYYLHTFDQVAGALHFDAGTESVVTIYQALQGRLPGYLLPKLVTEYPGQQAKTLVPITPLN